MDENRLSYQIATLITTKSAEDVTALASIDFSSIGRILRRAILVEIERHRNEIEKHKQLLRVA